MKKEIENIGKEKAAEPNGKKISRAQALKKVGYIAVSAATMMILLNSPSKANAQTTSPGPAAPTPFG